MANSDFIVWTTNPKLNNEEAFCAEIIVEKAMEMWWQKNRVVDPEGWGPKLERRKRRALNPAHRAKLDLKEVERAASVLHEIHHFWFHSSKYANDDRALRDLSGFRFLRGLKDFSLHGGEMKDISALAELPELQKITLWDEELENLSPIARCAKLESLSLHVSQPWPDLPPLNELPLLKHFEWRGNPFVLENLSPLPHVVKAKVEGGFQWKLPLRNLKRLPQMPLLRVLELDPAWSLDGIEQWTTITNLTLSGNIRDLQPLHQLSQLTHLTLKTDQLRNVQQLVGIPQLRHLLVESEHPVDFSSLTDAARLHEIEVKRCEINKMEIATLNSVLSPWDDEFALATPRTLSPLRIVPVPDKELFKTTKAEAASSAEVETNPGMLVSEAHWIKRKIFSQLKKLLRSDKWGSVEASEHGHRTSTIQINSLEAAERLSEILQSTREVLAGSKHRWECAVRISLKADWQQNHPELEKSLEKQRLIDEHLDWERRQQERKEFLERKHRADLLQQEGIKIKPEDFAAPEKEEAAEPDEDFESTLAIPDEPEPHPLARQLDCFARFTESELIVGNNQRAAVEHFLSHKD